MNTKRIIALLIAAIMVLSLVPVMTISTSAAAEGEWTTYQSAANYPDLTGEEVDEDYVAPPVAGYAYTNDGFSVVQPDWTGTTPWVTVSTTQTFNVKEGLYLEFRVDDYSYGWNAEEVNVDHWISVSLNTGAVEADGTRTGKVCPPNTNFGGGWNILLRSQGLGAGPAIGCQTTPDDKENEITGTFKTPEFYPNVDVPMDEDGREIYTLEVTWDGAQYIIKMNDHLISDGTVAGGATTALLEQLSPEGDFFVGITMMDTVSGGSAGLTVTKFGNSKETAVKPVGSDSKEPTENNIVVAPIADPTTVEENQPAILWNPDRYNLKNGNNAAFTVLGDDTWRGTASDEAVNFQLTAKNAWSYDAADFPVFGILLRNFWVDDATLWYATGNITSATNGYTYEFSVYDEEGEIYSASDDNEYIFVPIDLTGLADEGRINSMRIDMRMPNADTREFDVCFAGMFRSVDEAYAYVGDWFAGRDISIDAPVDDETTADPSDNETTAAPAETTAPATTEAPTTQAPTTEAPNGCGSVIGVSAVAILAAAAAAVALKKKD